MVVWNDLSNTQWLDYPSQSNILRRTYVNGFLDVSQNIIARKDMEVHGDISVNSINASGNVGIGTNNPGYKLDLNGDLRIPQNYAADGESSRIWFTNSNGYGDGFGDTSICYVGGPQYNEQNGSYLRFSTGGMTNALCIRKDGNVGIGTTSPEQKLHIRGNTNEYAVIAFEGVRSSGTEATREGFIGVGAAGGNYGTDMIFKLRNGYGAVTWDSGSQDVLYMNGNTTRFYTANTERMTIISSGNVGIGTNNPTQHLDVTGDALFRGDIYTGATNRFRLEHNGNNCYMDSFVGGFDFRTGSYTSRMYIASDGHVKIGNPQRYDGGNNSIGKLTVAGPISTPNNDFTNSTAILRVTASNASNNMHMGVGGSSYSYEPWIQAGYDNSNTSNNNYGNKRLRLNPLGGNVVRHGEDNYSDDRVKINETYITNATETLQIETTNLYKICGYGS